MTDVLIFKFPDLVVENKLGIERQYCQLLNEYRNGERLDPEVLDWMDSANNYLISMESA